MNIEDAEAMGGPGDGYERLWTPHRMAYVKDAFDRKGLTPEQGCPFCLKIEEDDRPALVVARGENCFVVLNLYPYNPGHLMVCPYRHVAMYWDLTDAERDEMAAMTQIAMRVLEATSNATGFNIGMNQGKSGGAGIAEHIHQHVVPRWTSDANFLPIIARTKAMSELLDETWCRVSEGWTRATSTKEN